MTPRTTLLLASFAAALCGGCAAESGCTLDIRQSVTMTVLDAQGEAVDGVAVHYSVNDGPLREAACFPDMDGACTVWIAGEEEGGVFQIEASTPHGQTLTTSVFVAEDECHVDTQHVDLVVP